MSVEIVKGFLSKDICKQIYDKSKSCLEENFGVARGYRESFVSLPPAENLSEDIILENFNYFNIKDTIENKDVAKMISATLYGMSELIESFYSQKIKEVQSSLIKMLEGAKNDLHSDMYLLDGSEWHGGHAQRSSFKYSAILYLSSIGKHFNGGQICFPEHDLCINPEAGDLVFFRGDLEHKHYVTKVTDGERLSLVAFFKP